MKTLKLTDNEFALIVKVLGIELQRETMRVSGMPDYTTPYGEKEPKLNEFKQPAIDHCNAVAMTLGALVSGETIR